MTTALRKETLEKFGAQKFHPIEVENEIPKDFPTWLGDFTACVLKQTDLEGWEITSAVNRMKANLNLRIFTTPEGKLPKRISHWFHKEIGIDLSPEHEKALQDKCAAIGQACSNNHERWHVNVSRRAWWKAGSFGDGDSCFWGDDRFHLRELNLCKNFLALTVASEGHAGCRIAHLDGFVHPDYSLLTGRGRAWMFFDENDKGQFAVCGCYGLQPVKILHILGYMFNEHLRSNIESEINYGPTTLYDYGPTEFFPKDEKPLRVIYPGWRNGDVK